MDQNYNKDRNYITWTFYCQECVNESESNAISTIDIVVGDDLGQGKFRSVYKFILRDINVKNLDSYIIKNAHIGCDKDTHDFFEWFNCQTIKTNKNSDEWRYVFL